MVLSLVTKSPIYTIPKTTDTATNNIITVNLKNLIVMHLFWNVQLIK